MTSIFGRQKRFDTLSGMRKRSSFDPLTFPNVERWLRNKLGYSLEGGWARSPSRNGIVSKESAEDEFLYPPGNAQRTKILAVHCRTRSFGGKKRKEREKYTREIINHRPRRILREIRGVDCHLLGLERVRRVRWYPIFEEHARHVP